MAETANRICGVKLLPSPRIFQTYLTLFDQPFPNTAIIDKRLGPFMFIETRTVVILMIKYNHIIRYLHDDGASDGIHERKCNLIATCKVDVGSLLKTGKGALILRAILCQ